MRKSKCPPKMNLILILLCVLSCCFCCLFIPIKIKISIIASHQYRNRQYTSQRYCNKLHCALIAVNVLWTALGPWYVTFAFTVYSKSPEIKVNVSFLCVCFGAFIIKFAYNVNVFSNYFKTEDTRFSSDRSNMCIYMCVCVCVCVCVYIYVANLTENNFLHCFFSRISAL